MKSLIVLLAALAFASAYLDLSDKINDPKKTSSRTSPVEDHRREKGALQAELEDAEETILKQKREINDLKNAEETCETNVARLNYQKKSLRNELDHLITKIISEERRIREDLEGRIRGLESKCQDEYKTCLSSGRAPNVCYTEIKICSHRLANRKCLSEVENHQSAKEELQHKLKYAENTISKQEHKIKNLMNAIEEADRKVENHQRRTEELQGELKHAEKTISIQKLVIKDLMNAKYLYEADVTRFEEQNRRMKDELDKLKLNASS